MFCKSRGLDEQSKDQLARLMAIAIGIGESRGMNKATDMISSAQ